jgi:hypothetical protein
MLSVTIFNVTVSDVAPFYSIISNQLVFIADAVPASHHGRGQDFGGGHLQKGFDGKVITTFFHSSPTVS